MKYTNDQIEAWKEKADKWDALDEKIGKFYSDDLDEDDEYEDGCLLEIGEIAAMALGYM